MHWVLKRYPVWVETIFKNAMAFENYLFQIRDTPVNPRPMFRLTLDQVIDSAKYSELGSSVSRFADKHKPNLYLL